MFSVPWRWNTEDAKKSKAARNSTDATSPTSPPKRRNDQKRVSEHDAGESGSHTCLDQVPGKTHSQTDEQITSESKKISISFQYSQWISWGKMERKKKRSLAQAWTMWYDRNISPPHSLCPAGPRVSLQGFFRFLVASLPVSGVDVHCLIFHTSHGRLATQRWAQHCFQASSPVRSVYETQPGSTIKKSHISRQKPWKYPEHPHWPSDAWMTYSWREIGIAAAHRSQLLKENERKKTLKTWQAVLLSMHKFQTSTVSTLLQRGLPLQNLGRRAWMFSLSLHKRVLPSKDHTKIPWFLDTMLSFLLGSPSSCTWKWPCCHNTKLSLSLKVSGWKCFHVCLCLLGVFMFYDVLCASGLCPYFLSYQSLTKWYLPSHPLNPLNPLNPLPYFLHTSPPPRESRPHCSHPTSVDTSDGSHDKTMSLTMSTCTGAAEVQQFEHNNRVGHTLLFISLSLSESTWVSSQPGAGFVDVTTTYTPGPKKKHKRPSNGSTE